MTKVGRPRKEGVKGDILDLLEEEGRLYIREIARELDYSLGLVYDRIEELEKEGKIESERKYRMRFIKKTDE